MLTRYRFRGQVCVNDRCVANLWIGETVAKNKRKAISNLIYRFKKDNGLSLGARVSLMHAEKNLIAVEQIME